MGIAHKKERTDERRSTTVHIHPPKIIKNHVCVCVCGFCPNHARRFIQFEHLQLRRCIYSSRYNLVYGINVWIRQKKLSVCVSLFAHL